MEPYWGLAALTAVLIAIVIAFACVAKKAFAAAAPETAASFERMLEQGDLGRVIITIVAAYVLAVLALYDRFDTAVGAVLGTVIGVASGSLAVHRAGASK